MRVTVCELPHETTVLASAWAALCEHARAQASELVLLPEFAMVEPVWESEGFTADRWRAIEVRAEELLRRLPELDAKFVVGTRPARANGHRLNQGYLWSSAAGLQPRRSDEIADVDGIAAIFVLQKPGHAGRQLAEALVQGSVSPGIAHDE